MFKFCVSKATSLISRNMFDICSPFNVKVNDMLNGNVKFKNDNNEEQVRQTELVRETLEMKDKVIDIDGFNDYEIHDMIDHICTLRFIVLLYL